jgi:hypothetical protein
MRYAWDLREAYLTSVSAARGFRHFAADRILDRLRRWDSVASNRVNRFIAISDCIANASAYATRDASVVYPPVDIGFFTPGVAPPSRDTYFTASRWVL